MAERSFKKEVQQLRLGEGATFHGEGILAITKALLQSGVAYVGGYQGSPISHLMDVLADASDILQELGVHFEASASEASAAAMLSASVMYPLRGAVTWKSTVGTNVASDALANLASGGVTGGTLIIVGEDYGEGSSIMQERSHAFAMKSQIWLLDPPPDLPSMVQAVEDGFALSEATRTPVMLQLRIRSCHVHGRFKARDNVRPPFTLAQALEQPRRDASRIVLPPAAYRHEQEKIQERWPLAVQHIERQRLNTFLPGERRDIGIVLQGGLYNNAVRALQLLGMADAQGSSRIPLYLMNVTYPVIEREVLRFCAGKRAVLLLEEGQPDYLEQNLHAVLRRADSPTRLHGKGFLPIAGEYTTEVIRQGLQRFLKQQDDAPSGMLARSLRRPPPTEQTLHFHKPGSALDAVVPARPAGFCTGCPERPVFSALTLVQQQLGEHNISCDIGCHLFSILPPFNLGATTMGYGLGAASASAFNVPAGKRSISIMGDGGFWHNGLTSGIGNAVFNKHDGVILIIDNFYASATGGQDIPSSRAANARLSTNHPIEAAVRGVGVSWVRRVTPTYNVSALREVLHEALTTEASGPKVIIAQSECMLNRQRREKPQFRLALEAGERLVRPRFGVDADVCTGDHACIRLSGCPSLSLRDSGDPLKPDPVAHVDASCVGCGHCGEAAHAAVLCPSFYRADTIHNPSPWERAKAGARRRLIGWLQGRRQRRLARRAG